MSTNTDALKAALIVKANELTDTISKYECLELIDQYAAALAKQAETVANDVTSYSIDGRSVTRSSQNSMQAQVANLKANINRLLYGNVTRADFREEELPETD